MLLLPTSPVRKASMSNKKPSPLFTPMNLIVLVFMAVAFAGILALGILPKPHPQQQKKGSPASNSSVSSGAPNPAVAEPGP
jgi:hypothetical protein